MSSFVPVSLLVTFSVTVDSQIAGAVIVGLCTIAAAVIGVLLQRRTQ